MTDKRRGKPGSGNVTKYATAQGPRWYIRYGVPDPMTGKRRQKIERGFVSEKAAGTALRERLVDVTKGRYVEPSKQTLADYLTGDWLPSLRNAASTQASYRRNLEQHVIPKIGGTPLAKLTGLQLTALYRELEASGRRDGKPGGLSARTVRYVHTIVHRALKDAVKHDRLSANPADKAEPPTAREARAPEMSAWRAEELRGFLEWSQTNKDELRVAWLLASMTGLRRGELLALRWRDVDLDAGTISVRRSVVVVKAKGAPRVEEGPTKSGRDRVVDLDPETVAALRAHRSAGEVVALQSVRDEGYVISRPDGSRWHPERFSREFVRRLERCRFEVTALDGEAPATIRLHDLRHTHATLLLKAGVPVKVVSERLGHASPMITLQTYAHVMPGMQQEAAAKFAALVYGGTGQ